MSQNPPDLSVVTVVLNDKVGLEAAIHSIKQQLGLSIEHIIVDGGSTDGSADIAARYSSIPIESRSDGGIYPAMNRGAAVATGKYLVFCNAGDMFFGNRFLAQAVTKLRKTQSSWGFGPIIEKTQRGTFSWVPADRKAKSDSIISRESFVPFPTFIIDRNFYSKVGPLNSKYKIAGDFELICKSALSSDPIIFDSPIAIFSAGGISYSKADEAWREEIAIRKDLLHLNEAQLLNESIKFQLRFLKWKIGKVIDLFQTSIFPNKISWRDIRALDVPKEYKKYLL